MSALIDAHPLFVDIVAAAIVLLSLVLVGGLSFYDRRTHRERNEARFNERKDALLQRLNRRRAF